MMRVRMTRLAAGPMGVWPPGTELDLERDLAAALVESGAAVPVVARYERAVVKPVEVRDEGYVETDSRANRRTRKPR